MLRKIPIASDDVAAILADIIVGELINNIVEIAGPNRMSLAELVQNYLTKFEGSHQIIADVHARYFGAEVNDQSLVPGDNPRIGKVNFEAWAAQIGRMSFIRNRWSRITTSTYRAGRPGKAHQMAACSLLADVYLTMTGWPLKQESNYKLAADEANAVIQSNQFNLNTAYAICEASAMAAGGPTADSYKGALDVAE